MQPTTVFKSKGQDKLEFFGRLAELLSVIFPPKQKIVKSFKGGRTGLMVRASDFGSGGPGSILGRVGVFVSLSKRHILPKSTGNTQE